MFRVLPFLIGYGALGLFFVFGRDAEAKRRLWPLYTVGSGAMFLWIVWYAGILRSNAAFLIPLVAAITWFNIRSTKFCHKCGRMSQRGFFASGPAFCPKCGVDLADKR